MGKSALTRTMVLARLRQFEQDAAQAALLQCAHAASQAEQIRAQRREEAEAIGGWKVPAANGGTIELAVYAHALQAEVAAMMRLSEAEQQVMEADRAKNLARELYGRAVLASDVVDRREQRLAISVAIQAEHYDADVAADMWLAGVKHERD